MSIMILVRVFAGCTITCTCRPDSNSYTLFPNYIWSSLIKLITYFRQVYCIKQFLLTFAQQQLNCLPLLTSSPLSKTALAITVARDLIIHVQLIKSTVCNSHVHSATFRLAVYPIKSLHESIVIINAHRSKYLRWARIHITTSFVHNSTLGTMLMSLIGLRILRSHHLGVLSNARSSDYFR